MTEPRSARQQLIEWANQQHAWVRAIASEVLNTQQPPATDVLEAAYQAALAQYDLSEDAPPEVSRLVADEERTEQTDTSSYFMPCGT